MATTTHIPAQATEPERDDAFEADEANETNETNEAERKDANTMLGMGLGVGVFGAASALLIGATCPLCVVVAPALVGAGIYKRVRCRRQPGKSDDDA